MTGRGIVAGVLAAVLLASCTDVAAPRALVLPTISLAAPPLPALEVTRIDPADRPGEDVAPSGPRAGSGFEVVPGELLVGRDPATPLPGFEGAEVLQSLPLGRTYDLVRVPVRHEAAATAFYQGTAGVRSVAPNAYLEPHAIPPTNDPLLPYNWQYDSRRADVYSAWTDIDNSLLANLQETVVAVVDSGVDAGHPDFGSNALPGYLTTAALDKTFPPTGASFDQNADDHGTRVAGVIGALKNNGVGGAGVAPGCKILPLKDLDPATGRISTSGLINAITLAAYYNQADSPFTWLRSVGDGKPVSVINVSQGVPGSFGVQAAYSDAIDTAVAHGICVVTSTGNEATDVTVPANSPGAIAVGVTMRYLDWEFGAPYSNHGDAVFVSAPGNMIWSTAKGTATGDYSRAYKLFNGTSAAAPFAAATLALISAKYTTGLPRNRALADRARLKLRLAVDDMGPAGWDPLYGWGRVNVRKAVQGVF